MKKNATSFGALVFLAFSTVLSGGCRKVLDYDKDRNNGDVDCKSCNIQQISVFFTDELGPDTIIYTFNYNAFGDPITVKNTDVATGNPNSVFKYDKFGRLKEFIRPYENQIYETWTKYTCNLKGQVIRDTQYVFGLYIDSVPDASPNKDNYRVSQFSYDQQDRVVKRVDSSFSNNLLANVDSTAFYYDAAGNLVGLGTAYDAHLSLFRTNKIWMFITCNYSINNGFQAAAYNAHGLPLQFQGSYQTLFPIVSAAGQFNVKYACK
jgi:hypothetical protein